MKFSKSFIVFLLVLIILMGAVLRFYATTPEHKLHFTNDEARDALTIKSHFDRGVPFSVGPEIYLSNQEHTIYFGAFYYYLIAPAYIATGFSYYSPIAAEYLIIILSIATIYLIYLLGKKLFSEAMGLVAAFLYATSFMLVEYVWPWNPNPAPFFICLFLLFIFDLIEKKDDRYWIPIGLVCGLLSQLHLVNALFYPIFFLILIVCKRKTTLKNLLFSILAFIVTYIPFIIRECLNNFSVTKGYIAIFGGNEGKVFFSLDKANEVFTRITNNFFSLPDEKYGYFALVFFVLAMISFALTYKKNSSKILAICFLIFYIGFAKFNSLQFFWHYSLPLAPIIILSVCSIFNILLLNKKLYPIGVVCLILFLSIVSYNNINKYTYWLATDIPQNTSDLKYPQIKGIVDMITADGEKDYAIRFENYRIGNENSFKYLFETKNVRFSESPKYVYVISSLDKSPYDKYIWKKNINLTTVTKINPYEVPNYSPNLQ